MNRPLPCSSAVERSPVKRLVVSSNLTGGADDLCNIELEKTSYSYEFFSMQVRTVSNVRNQIDMILYWCTMAISP